MKRILILIFGTLSVFVVMIIIMSLMGYTPKDTLMQVCVGVPSAYTYFFLDKKTKP